MRLHDPIGSPTTTGPNRAVTRLFAGTGEMSAPRLFFLYAIHHFYKSLILLVGAAGFEPATLCSQSRCATGLRYAPPMALDYTLTPKSASKPQ